jgi:hypothetical protein
MLLQTCKLLKMDRELLSLLPETEHENDLAKVVALRVASEIIEVIVVDIVYSVLVLRPTCQHCDHLLVEHSQQLQSPFFLFKQAHCRPVELLVDQRLKFSTSELVQGLWLDV